MTKGLKSDEDLWIEGLNRQFEQLDQMFEDVDSPSLKQLEMLAVQTAENRRRRMRNEFLIFLLIAVSIVSGSLMAALATPMIFILIHGISLLSGIAILLWNKRMRGEEKRELQ